MNLKKYLLVLIALCIPLITLGCYTTFRPPKLGTKQEHTEQHPDSSYYYEYHYYFHWNSFYDPYWSYYPSQYRWWRYYYGYPWWWDDWYWSHLYDPPESYHKEEGERLERRRGLTTPPPGWGEPPKLPPTPVYVSPQWEKDEIPSPPKKEEKEKEKEEKKRPIRRRGL